jgi:hypothetical protein
VVNIEQAESPVPGIHENPAKPKSMRLVLLERRLVGGSGRGDSWRRSSLKSATGQGMRSAPSSPTQIGTWPSGTRTLPCRDAFTTTRESRQSKRFMLPLSERGTGAVEVLAAAMDDLTAGVLPYAATPGTTSRRRCSYEERAKGLNDISYYITFTLTNHKFSC